MKPSDKEKSGAVQSSSQDEAPLPQEGDEQPKPANAAKKKTKDPSRQRIEQAARDISRGLRDTDRHGTPSDVPGPGIDPEHSPGADVPQDEVADGGNSKQRKQ